MDSQSSENPERIRAEISSFKGDYAFLSNFYYHPMIYQGTLWKTSEHCYQAQKTTNMVEIENIRAAYSPADAKKRGKQCTMRPEWDDIKFQVMEDILRVKFSDPELAKKLVATGDAELIEGNTWHDRTFGCEMVNGEWEGRNMLGRILMKIREELANGKS